MNNIIEDFCNRHGIRILNSSKRAYRVTKINVEYFKYVDDFNKVDYIQPAYETEPLYTIEISKSEFERIAEFEDQVFNHKFQRGHFNLFETLMEQKHNEKMLREKYAAVKKAYENYSLLLKLANSGELDITDA